MDVWVSARLWVYESYSFTSMGVVYGYLWVVMGFWVFMGAYEYLWVFMGVCRFLGVYGCLWVSGCL